VTTIASFLVAAEERGHNFWYPRLAGYTVVLCAIILFCGSVYLLLWTNVGSSIGFLLSGAAVAGIMLMLSTLWVTGQFPNGKLGSLPKWNVIQVVGVQGSDVNAALAQSPVGLVRNIPAKQTPEATQAIAGQIKADLDADITGTTAKPEDKLYGTADDYKAVKTWQVGGARKMPIWWSKKGEYAAVQVCTLTKVPDTYDQLNNPPFVPDCDPAQPQRVIVLHHDLGSLRRPAAFTMAGSAVLLAGFLYGLYLVEIRQRQAAAAPPADAPVPATT
jgi:hypothetical protein